ncbi:MAG TPA: hypothetical protein PL033_12845 [Candidatus Brocadiia bacterium]|nr:hypothetical protein [Candidatus Brocadiia bacterium]
MGVWHVGAVCAAAFALTALTYFHNRKALCGVFMCMFLVVAPWFGRLGLGALSPWAFWCVTALFWGAPVLCLVIFILDYRFGIVTVDTIFAFVIFWALCPIYFAACAVGAFVAALAGKV